MVTGWWFGLWIFGWNNGVLDDDDDDDDDDT